MLQELTVRILIGVIILTFIALAFPYRLKAHKSKDKLDRIENEGGLLFFVIRLAGFSLWIICFLFPFFPQLFSRFAFSPTLLTQIPGLLMAIISLPLGLWVFKSIGKNITDTVTTRTNHELVTTGIYKHIRHPLYTAGFLLFAGLGLLASNWLMLILTLIVVAALVIRTGKEEKKLMERFGNIYVIYSKNTGRFFPLLKLKK
jgi:protein-S-isoprenylcysteine O-methyltransferase Ste14